jgi:hypothetical protein
MMEKRDLHISVLHVCVSRMCVSHVVVMDLSLSFSAIITAVMHKLTFARKRLVPLALSPNKADLEFLVELLKDDGNMKTLIDSMFPLSDVAKAWEKSMEGPGASQGFWRPGAKHLNRPNREKNYSYSINIYTYQYKNA